VREAVLRNPGLPLPSAVRPLVDAIGWPLQKPNLLSQYGQTGPTRYDENSQKQADALQQALKDKGVRRSPSSRRSKLGAAHRRRDVHGLPLHRARRVAV